MRETTWEIDGRSVPVRSVNTVIVGAGAAGMGAAVQLVRRWRARGVHDPAGRLLVVTAGLDKGCSRMSGSDKQTYYKLGTSPCVPDTAADFARTLTAFGCCHGDTALAEGLSSLRGFYNLVEAGVPFPHDPYGAFVGYKTDHDPYERATSAGPKTSRFMSECLQAVARREGVEILDRKQVAGFVTGPDGGIWATVCLDLDAPPSEQPAACVLVAETWILAAGGPGEIYEVSVYPREQYGIHGAALEAGLEACNLTESQFGLASVGFRWNVSGTYMQVVPRIYSTDPGGGDEREFLTEYFTDMSTMATAIFLKGYQWPFDAQRITDHQSSLVDMAVHQETVVRGRRVWMDFLANPVGAADWDDFHLSGLGDEALEYLERTGALQATPIERLEHMNPPAIAIYRENGIDLTAEPLEIGLCAQHMNGGFAVDKWWQSSVLGTFVVGEMAGTHGVKRPGGSALNAGQVGAARAADYIAGARGTGVPDAEAARPGVEERLRSLFAAAERTRKSGPDALAPSDVMAEIRRRMTRYGAHLRSEPGAAAALAEAVGLWGRIEQHGWTLGGEDDFAAAVRARQQCLTHVAILKAICELLRRGAGSRGSHCVLDPDGLEMHAALIDPQTDAPYCFRLENEALRGEILQLRYAPQREELFEVRTVPPREIPARDVAFEPAWAEYRDGRIYEI